MKKFAIAVCMSIVSFMALGQNSALEVQKFVLDNGFTVYLNEDQTASTVYGAVVVKAGSKNDPADATGIAHYLEHMLFKGTTELGTKDFEKEKPLLDSINLWYDSLGRTADKETRKAIQLQINDLSVRAAEYGLPAEFDKLVKSIGGTWVNAFTTNDMTVYHNVFPSEQMERWLDLYSHRFIEPVFRGFQAELEVVYEEKNRSMDAIGTDLLEEMNRRLFKNHPYGTQTTLGKVEHLKNPSLTKMYEFFHTYYVANNMGLILTGNFNTDSVLPLIREKFGQLRTGIIPEFPDYPVSSFSKNETINMRSTPIKISILGFKAVPNNHPDEAPLEIMLSLLSNNSETGKIDKLVRDHKIMYAGGFNYSFNDDGAIVYMVIPKLFRQSFSKAEGYLLAAIDSIKAGHFSDKDLQIIKTGLYRQQKLYVESHDSRAYGLMQVFSTGSTWEEYLDYSNKLNAVTREDIIRVANKYLNAPHLTIRSGKGKPKKEVLDKPGFEPVVNEQTDSSSYARYFNTLPDPDPVPKFLSDNTVQVRNINESHKLYAVKNPVNDVFSLVIEFRVGTETMPNLDAVSDLMSFFKTTTYTTDQLKEEFAKVGLTYYAYAGRTNFTIRFTGLDQYFDESLVLINQLLHEADAEQKSMKIVLDAVKSNRKTQYADHGTIGSALFYRAALGSRSYYLDRLSKKEIRKLKVEELLADFNRLQDYNAVWRYTGTIDADSVRDKIDRSVLIRNNQKEQPLVIHPLMVTDKRTIYVLNDKKAVQNHVYFVIKTDSLAYTALDNVIAAAFNEYMGGGFSGLILQEIREFRSLAYSSSGRYITPAYTTSRGWFYSYVGCQADKTNEAIRVMLSLLDSMPEKPDRLDAIRSGLKKTVSAEYPDFRYIADAVELNDRKERNPRYVTKEEYALYDSISFDDIETFYRDYLQGRPMVITIYGNLKAVDLKALSAKWTIVELKKKHVFRK